MFRMYCCLDSVALFIDRVNEYSKPIFPKMMQILERTEDSYFYGYVNGDILLSYTVFALLPELHSNEHANFLIQTGVSFC